MPNLYHPRDGEVARLLPKARAVNIMTRKPGRVS